MINPLLLKIQVKKSLYCCRGSYDRGPAAYGWDRQFWDRRYMSERELSGDMSMK